jgi:hypothetical protein
MEFFLGRLRLALKRNSEIFLEMWCGRAEQSKKMTSAMRPWIQIRPKILALQSRCRGTMQNFPAL